jgi:hypothetical protein
VPQSEAPARLTQRFALRSFISLTFPKTIGGNLTQNQSLPKVLLEG